MNGRHADPRCFVSHGALERVRGTLAILRHDAVEPVFVTAAEFLALDAVERQLLF